MSSTTKLYHGVGSPVSRACLMLIRQLNLNVEVKLVNMASGEHLKPDFLKISPLHQLPVLVDGDFVLTESRAILAYLVNKFKPGSLLYPTDPKVRAVVDQRLYYDATVVYASVGQIVVRSFEIFSSVIFLIQYSREPCSEELKRFHLKADKR